jgi:ubiquinone/menaquinone biosynthesis C-methylase UbiE
MAVTCDYTGISEYYEDWCMGDDAFVPVASFYLDYLSKYTGVFAELGVGTGRIARPLSQRTGVSVYGIDSCEAMLEQCRKQMSPDMALTLINTNFLDFNLPRKADVILYAVSHNRLCNERR